jgi:hypothetical protein
MQGVLSIILKLKEPGQLPCLNKQRIESKLREKVF